MKVALASGTDNRLIQCQTSKQNHHSCAEIKASLQRSQPHDSRELPSLISVKSEVIGTRNLTHVKR